MFHVWTPSVSDFSSLFNDHLVELPPKMLSFSGSVHPKNHRLKCFGRSAAWYTHHTLAIWRAIGLKLRKAIYIYTVYYIYIWSTNTGIHTNTNWYVLKLHNVSSSTLQVVYRDICSMSLSYFDGAVLYKYLHFAGWGGLWRDGWKQRRGSLAGLVEDTWGRQNPDEIIYKLRFEDTTRFLSTSKLYNSVSWCMMMCKPTSDGDVSIVSIPKFQDWTASQYLQYWSL